MSGSVIPFPGASQPMSQLQQPMSQLGGPPPGMMPNPQFAMWQKAYQEQQALVQKNNEKQKQFDAAFQLIKEDGLRGFRLDIEADSTIAPDEQAEQQSRTQFVAQITPFLQQAAVVGQGNPTMAKLLGEIGLFAIRGFRVARPLEEAFEAAFEALGQMPPPPPKNAAAAKHNPEIEAAKIKSDNENTKAKVGADMQDSQLKAQTDQMAIAQKQQQAMLTAQQQAAKIEAERERDQTKVSLEMMKLEAVDRHHSDQIAAQNAKGME